MGTTEKRHWVAEEGTTRSSVGEKPSSELEHRDRAAFSDRNRSERSIDRERRTKTLHPSHGLECPDGQNGNPGSVRPGW
jgi:hypothetical protein